MDYKKLNKKLLRKLGSISLELDNKMIQIAEHTFIYPEDKIKKAEITNLENYYNRLVALEEKVYQKHKLHINEII